MAKRIKSELPITKQNLLFSFFIISCSLAILYDIAVGTRFDGFIHDEAIISQPRKSWDNTAIIALDPGIPEYVSRKQALPLFGLAAENALNAGAAGVFLDAVIFEPSPNMQYAVCINTESNRVAWNDMSESFNPLHVLNSNNISHFSMPHPSPNVEIFTLFDLDTALAMEQEKVFFDMTLYNPSVDYFPASTRWLNLSRNSAVVNLADWVFASSNNPAGKNIQSHIDDVNCGSSDEKKCRRIRFTDHVLTYADYDRYPVIPLSEMVNCNNYIKPEIRKILQNRSIVIQVSSLNENIDMHLTPVSTSLFGNDRLVAGPQIIVDSVETLVSGDHPRRPVLPIRIALIIAVSLSCVLAGAYLKTRWAVAIALTWIFFTSLLCFIIPQTQLWPVTATALAGVISIVLCLIAHLVYGTKRGVMIARYLPAPIRSMLLSTGRDNVFINRKTEAAVLISDLAGYTTVTNLLNDPALVFDLINEYLEETTIVLQNKYHGWLENYVGDLVCFYWPVSGGKELKEQQYLALQAAIEQAELQQAFFRNIDDLKKLSIDPEILKRIRDIINAGIGVSTGEIVMGNIGPEEGVQKFSVLGDPLNLSSRIEGLTRHFNTEIIITSELVDRAEELGMKTRKIARIKVKGRTVASEIYALGKHDDPRFNEQTIEHWLQFCDNLENDGDRSASFPEILSKDASTLLNWFEQGLLDKEKKVWNLTSK